jgi:LacI family transcriptional regulator
MLDIAKHAGVSLSTVSHVVNKTRAVAPETAQQVEKAIAELGYTPNAVARSLATSTTRLVGFAISISTNNYFLDIVYSIEGACSAMGLTVALGDTRDDPEQELQVVRDFVQRRVDGVILAPGPTAGDGDKADSIDLLRSANVPFVLVDRIIGAETSGVALENVESMESLVRHLAWHGHKRIALVANEPGLRSTIERTAGFHRAMQRHDLPIDPAYVLPGNPTSESACRQTHYLLDLPNPPTAIAAGNNMATIGVMKAARDRGLRVPEDLALIGFDDFEWADCFEPRLTVVAQPCEMIGRRAAELLIEHIQDPDRPPVTLRLPSTLIIRRSCGCGG